MGAVSYVAQERFREIDIVADKVGNKDRKYPSLHEAPGIVLIGHPSLCKAEARTEEEKCYRQDTVVVIIIEFLHGIAVYI